MIPDITIVSVATLIGAAFIIWLILVVFFTPGINYHVESRQDACSSEFSHKLVATSQAVFYRGNRIEALTNGATFYPAMLQAIKASTQSVNLECYIFHPGEIADQFIEALIERARAGVKVTIVADAIGSARLGHPGQALRAAGCRFILSPLRWYRLPASTPPHRNSSRRWLVGFWVVPYRGLVGLAGAPRSCENHGAVEAPFVTSAQGVFVEFCNAAGNSDRRRVLPTSVYRWRHTSLVVRPPPIGPPSRAASSAAHRRCVNAVSTHNDFLLPISALDRVLVARPGGCFRSR